MFDWLKKKAIAKVTSDQSAEVVEWTKFLKSADSEFHTKFLGRGANLAVLITVYFCIIILSICFYLHN